MKIKGIQTMKRRRFQYLYTLCTKLHYSTLNAVFDYRTIGAGLGFDDQAIDEIVSFLLKKNLVQYGVSAPSIRMTVQGIEEIEKALGNPNASSRYFPPAVNVINIRKMVNSEIQQGDHQSPRSKATAEAGHHDLEEKV